MNVLFWHFGIFFSSGRGSFSRALGSAARRKPAWTSRANLGAGRGPWHVLWGFKVASLLGEAFRARRATQAPANPRRC